MTRWLALAIVGAMLAVPAASAGASWTQAGYDAARTANPPMAGPAAPDVAFNVRLPGFASDDMLSAPLSPIVHEGSAYAPVRALDYGEGEEALDLSLHGIARVDLATGEVERVVEIGSDEEWRRVIGLALGEDHLFLTTMTYPGVSRVEAYRLSDYQRSWTWEAPNLFGDEDASNGTPVEGVTGSSAMQTWLSQCAQPAVVDGTVYHSCNQRRSEGSDTEPTDRTHTYIVSLDAQTGERQDFWTTHENDQWASRAIQEDGGASLVNTRMVGLTVIGDHVYGMGYAYKWLGACPPTMGTCTGAWAHDATFMVVALDTDLTYQWRYATHLEDAGLQTPAGAEQLSDEGFAGGSVHPTGEPGEVYLRVQDKVLKLNPNQGGQEIWNETIGQEDTQSGAALGGFALGEEAVYTISASTIYRLDRDNPDNQWKNVLDPTANARFEESDLILAEDTLYAIATLYSGDDYNGSRLYAVDAETGEVRWTRDLPIDQVVAEYKEWNLRHFIGAGDGVIAVLGGDASFWVIGETNASIEPKTDPSTEYPSPDEEVSVDLSGTEPGVHGDATMFKAIWGDGTETDWQSDPVLTHTYDEAGDVTARFIVANDANQTASITQTFHVGQEAPTEPNWIEERFEKENQDMTFGVLGILVAVSGGAIGVARRKRKQATLQEELETLEAGFEDTKDNPGECEAFLETRKARARSLMLDGDLTEEQFGVIESRVEELGRELRTSVLDERFQFLPYGMVQSLKKMLADGKISGWEREAFETLLEDEEALSEAQKERVRGQLDRWLAEDAGGGAA